MSMSPAIAVLLVLSSIGPVYGLMSATREIPNTKDGALESCLGHYAQGLDLIRKGLGATARELSEQGVSPVRTSDRELVVNIGPGTTGTHYVADLLTKAGLNGSHWDITDPFITGLLDIVGRCYPQTFEECRKEHTTSKEHGRLPETRILQCHEQLRSFDYTALPDKWEFVSDSPFPELFVHMYRAFPSAKFVLSLRPAHEWAQQRLNDHRRSLALVQEPCGMSTNDFSIDENAQMLKLHNDLVRCAVPQSRLIEFDIFTDPDCMDWLPSTVSKFLGRS